MNVGKNNIDRKVYTLKDYRGVDYASSPLEVQPYRATDMANLLLRDGMLQKRYGFKQKFNVGVAPKYGWMVGGKKQTFGWFFETRLFKCGANAYGPVMIAQYYETREDISTFVAYGRDSYHGEIKELGRKEIWGARTATSVYVGKKLYLFAGSGIYTTDGTCNNGALDMQTITPYVPTTTINIPLMAAARTENGESGVYKFVSDSDIYLPYQSNESLNMLTSKRKNSILVRADFDYSDLFGDVIDVGARFFKLDGVARMSDVWDAPKITANVAGENVELGSFILHELDSRKVWVNESIGLSLYEKRSSWLTPMGNIADTASVLAVTSRDKFKAALSGSTLQANEYGYITLTLEYEPYFEKIADSNEDTESIYGAKTAVTFGVGGADDRIFLGGGGIHPHRVYFSENTSKYQADVTYFPVDQWLECGLSGSPISAMMKASDGTLAIFKDVSAYDDVSVYYANGVYESLGTGEEGNEYSRARFTIKGGDIRRSGISARAIANLEGDNIFTSKEGVYGIQLSSNVASGERYAKERSRTINPKITQFKLEEARSIIYKDRYFLAVGNGEVYVADARYKYTQKGDQENTVNYEWFRLTGLFVEEWFIYEEKLHFVDKDGYICEFTDKFTDEYLLTGTAGLNELSVSDGKVTFNSERLELIKSASYAVDDKDRVWQITLTADETAFYIPEDIKNVNDGDSLTLWFCVPVVAYWQSAVLDLGAPMYLKNMWSLSMVASAKHGGKINLGYKTRMNSVSGIQVEGANEGSLADISLFGGEQVSSLTGDKKTFGMFTFDMGGYVGINTYRRRLFDRNFAHIQLLFTSETTTDCAVAEMDVEYAITRKNIGVG